MESKKVSESEKGSAQHNIFIKSSRGLLKIEKTISSLFLHLEQIISLVESKVILYLEHIL